ncbi:MAG: hypothetical protein IKA44_05185 [Clostridia bacterium]|nr:hypothetical protein [Clostridia bacterium]
MRQQGKIGWNVAREKGYVPQAPSVTLLRATSMFCLQNSTPLAAGPLGGRLAESDAFPIRRLFAEIYLFFTGRRGRRSLQDLKMSSDTVLLKQWKTVIIWIPENDIEKEIVGTGVLDGPRNKGQPQPNGEAKNENPREIRRGLPSVVRRSQTTQNRDEQIHRGFLCDR